MEKKEGKSSNSGLFAGIFCALAGVAVGVAGKLIYDEVTKDEKEEARKRIDDLAEKKKAKELEKENQNNRESITITTDEEIEYESFFCPINQEIMREPVITPLGISYEKKAIVDWLKKSNVCPITKSTLKESDLITNYALKSTIEGYLRKHKEKTNSK